MVVLCGTQVRVCFTYTMVANNTLVGNTPPPTGCQRTIWRESHTGVKLQGNAMAS